MSKDVDLHIIATETNNYTGADLNGLLYTTLSIAEKKLLKGTLIIFIDIIPDDSYIIDHSLFQKE